MTYFILIIFFIYLKYEIENSRFGFNMIFLLTFVVSSCFDFILTIFLLDIIVSKRLQIYHCTRLS
jgi:hypothetical protein